MTPRHFNAIRDELAALLAAEAGVTRDNRVYSNFTSQAVLMLGAHDHSPPAITDTPADRLCLEHFSAKEAALAQRRVVDASRQAQLSAQIEARNALTEAPDGFCHVHLRDETSGKLLRLTLPVEIVQQV